MSKIIGLGGVFIKSPNTIDLRKWYTDTLGIQLEDWGTVLPISNLPASQSQVFSIMPDTTAYQAADKSYMINWMVDDLEKFVENLRKKGQEVELMEKSEYGHFAHLLDPDGNKLELWQPPSS